MFEHAAEVSPCSPLANVTLVGWSCLCIFRKCFGIALRCNILFVLHNGILVLPLIQPTPELRPTAVKAWAVRLRGAS